jgi:hypothetical protein
MNIYESSLSQVAHSQSIDNTSDEHQRPAFDDKHVEKVLFVECGMFTNNPISLCIHNSNIDFLLIVSFCRLFFMLSNNNV